MLRAPRANFGLAYAGLPVALMNIASAKQLDMTARQAALLILKRYVQHCWSPTFEEFKGPAVGDETKIQMRRALLGLVTDEQRKIRAAASYVVSKIASSGSWDRVAAGMGVFN